MVKLDNTKPIPILILGDGPDTHSGLARIGHDLAYLLCSMPEFRVGYLGRGSVGRARYPWANYSYPVTGQWGEAYIEQVWNDLRQSQTGIILTVWDASRLLWFGDPDNSGLPPQLTHFLGPQRTFQKWGYFMQDSEGVVPGALPHSAAATMVGFDRVLMASKWAHEIAKRSMQHSDLDWLPHGINRSTFQPNPDGAQAIRSAWGVGGEDKLVGCLAKGSNILMADYTEKPIEDISIGDMVMAGHTPRSVTGLKPPHAEKTLKIKAQGVVDDLILTSEHPVFSVKRQDVICKIPSMAAVRNYACRPNRDEISSEPCHSCNHDKATWSPAFNKAEDLVVGDFLAIPIPTDEATCFYSKYRWIDADPGPGVKLPDLIDLSNPEILFILGLYAAEGSVSRSKDGLTGINFSLHSLESDQADKITAVMAAWGHKARRYSRESEGRKSLEVCVSGRELAFLMLALLGEHSGGKRWHRDLMALPPDLQYQLLLGYYAGDGHNYKLEPGNAVIVSKSRSLIRGAWYFLLRNRILASCRKYPDRFEVYFPLPGRAPIKTAARSFIYGAHFYTPITSIKTNEVLEVFDFEVDELHQYVSGGACVHNCVMANQARKHWPTVLEAIAMSTHKPKLWLRTDTLVNYWNIPALVYEYGLSERVIIEDRHLTDTDMAMRYSACDATIMISGGEGFCYPVAESLSCGTPVVTGAYGAQAELAGNVVASVYSNIDTIHNVRRAYYGAVHGWLDSILGTPPSPDDCVSRVAHLDWKRIGKVWEKWLRRGIQCAS